MFDKEKMRSLVNKFPREFEKTSSNRFRRGNDIQLAFSYYYFIIEEGKWQYEIDETDDTWRFVEINYKWNIGYQLTKLKKWPKKFICVNDNIAYPNKNEAHLLLRSINRFFEKLFPNKSQFEI